MCNFHLILLFVFPACGFGRRASDGGANLQQKEKQQQSCDGGWSHPSSREQLSTVRFNSFTYPNYLVIPILLNMLTCLFKNRVYYDVTLHTLLPPKRRCCLGDEIVEQA